MSFVIGCILFFAPIIFVIRQMIAKSKPETPRIEVEEPLVEMEEPLSKAELKAMDRWFSR